jgi:hypothetical protein
MDQVQFMSDFFYPKIESVKALTEWNVRTVWSTGETLDIDLSKLMKLKAFAEIRQAHIFKKVHLKHGHLEWFDTELGADNVYAWGKEQSGEVSHEMFEAWMARNNLSLTTAATALGVSRRMVSYYRTATKAIPRSIWLACLGWEITKPNDTLPRTLPSVQEYASFHA